QARPQNWCYRIGRARHPIRFLEAALSDELYVAARVGLRWTRKLLLAESPQIGDKVAYLGIIEATAPGNHVRTEAVRLSTVLDYVEQSGIRVLLRSGAIGKVVWLGGQRCCAGAVAPAGIAMALHTEGLVVLLRGSQVGFNHHRRRDGGGQRCHGCAK